MPLISLLAELSGLLWLWLPPIWTGSRLPVVRELLFVWRVSRAALQGCSGHWGCTAKPRVSSLGWKFVFWLQWGNDPPPSADSKPFVLVLQTEMLCKIGSYRNILTTPRVLIQWFLCVCGFNFGVDESQQWEEITHLPEMSVSLNPNPELSDERVWNVHWVYCRFPFLFMLRLNIHHPLTCSSGPFIMINLLCCLDLSMWWLMGFSVEQIRVQQHL